MMDNSLEPSERAERRAGLVGGVVEVVVLLLARGDVGVFTLLLLLVLSSSPVASIK